MRQPHAAQHVGCLCELNVVVTDYFYSVAPGVPKIKKRPVEGGNTSRLECLAGGLLVVDDEAKVATIVCRLPAALLKRNELIAQIKKSHGVTFAAQFELEETAIECQRLIDRRCRGTSLSASAVLENYLGPFAVNEPWWSNGYNMFRPVALKSLSKHSFVVPCLSRSVRGH
jgi:hypothetical protein